MSTSAFVLCCDRVVSGSDVGAQLRQRRSNTLGQCPGVLPSGMHTETGLLSSLSVLAQI